MANMDYRLGAHNKRDSGGNINAGITGKRQERHVALARRRRFGRDLHRHLPVRRAGRQDRDLEGAVDAGRSVARHRPGRGGGHAPRRARGGEPSGRADRLFRPRHHGGDQCPHPASRRQDRPDHHRRLPRPAGDRPPEAARPLRHPGRQAQAAGAARPAPRSTRARAPHRRDRHAARRAEDARRRAGAQGGRRAGGRRFLPLRLRPSRP